MQNYGVGIKWIRPFCENESKFPLYCSIKRIPVKTPKVVAFNKTCLKTKLKVEILYRYKYNSVYFVDKTNSKMNFSL